jgi:HNH endonuclease
MRYLLQRVVHNDLQWKSPSIGRRGSTIDPGYLAENGFAHEDWNFSNDTANDGMMHGYAYFHPSDIDDVFNIAFVTYDKGEVWALAGLYKHAKFDLSGATYSNTVLRRRATQLLHLDSTADLGGDYEGLSLEKLIAALRRGSRDYRWTVTVENAHSLAAPIIIPDEFLPRNVSHYFTRPTNISEAMFNKVVSLASYVVDKNPSDDYSDGGGIEFPEGKKQQTIHYRRERSAKLVKHVKSEFKRKHGRLYCEACEFDFERTYGQVGVDFIEAHHVIPVSELQPGSKTRPSDMALVCSNCHRMLHKKRPWMAIGELRALLIQRRNH